MLGSMGLGVLQQIHIIKHVIITQIDNSGSYVVPTLFQNLYYI